MLENKHNSIGLQLDTLPLSENEQAFLLRLSQKAPRFREIREALGVTPAVGLGIFPELHELNHNSLGIATKVTVGSDGNMYSQGRNRVRKLEPTFGIVMPDPQETHTALVSVYKASPENPRDIRPELLSIPDEALDGVFAHELGHWRMDFGKPLPPELSLILRQIQGNQWMHNIFDPSRKDTRREAAVDLVVGWFGYQRQIEAALAYILELSDLTSFFDIAAVSKNIEYRLQQVRKYCS